MAGHGGCALPFFLKTWASTKSYASASYLMDRSAPERPLNQLPGILMRTRSSACSRAGYWMKVKSARLTGIAAAVGTRSSTKETGVPAAELHGSSGHQVSAVCLPLTNLGRQSCLPRQTPVPSPVQSWLPLRDSSPQSSPVQPQSH